MTPLVFLVTVVALLAAGDELEEDVTTFTVSRIPLDP